MDWDFANELDVDKEVDGNTNDNHNNDSGNDQIDVGKNAGEDIEESSLLKDFDAVLQDDIFAIDVDVSFVSNSSVPEIELRRILLRWRQGEYQQMPSSLFLAYFLQKKYDLSARKPVLAGKDAHRVCFVNTVAGDLGYVVFLADYERLVIRQNHHLQGIVSKTTIHISRIVDVNGKPISRDTILKPQLDSVIEPKYLEPDDEWTIEGIHIWLDSIVSRHWFRGTVLLLIHADDVEDILIAAMETQDAFLELRSCSATSYPTAKTKKLVRHILKLLASDIGMDRSAFRSMAELALDRHDLDLWNQLVALSNYDSSLLHLPLLKRSCQVFGFNVARPSLERMLSSSTLDETVAFISDIPSYLSQFEDTAELDAWYKAQVASRLKVDRYWDEDYISHLMTIARTFGIRCLFAVPLHMQDYDWEYVLDFAETLQNDRQSILSLRVNRVTSDDVIGGLHEDVDPCASPQQVMDRLVHRLVYCVFNQVTQSLQWLDELFMMSGQSCQGMLQDILDLPLKDETLKLREVYIPLVRRLCPLLKEFKHTVYSSTFGPFICHVIELYSRLLLGSRTYNPQFETLLRVIEEKFTCDCRECADLNGFMKQLYVPERTFLVSRSGMRHFARQLMCAPRLARYRRLQNGRCIKVIKSDTFSEHRWDVRVGHFRDFLRSIGDEDAIEKLMGDRYVDLKKSVES
ncbi:hypothetical protein APHAL10511_002405 [Amanita phalloides]|nr:hypothetical protein APHAL10511_002405 [Amanita phalloides]